MSIIRREVVCSQTGDVRPTIFPTDGASLHSFNLSFFSILSLIQIYSVIIISSQNTKKYKMTNTKREKQNTSILFLSNSFASSLVPVWQPTDRPTDKRKVFFIGSCAQPVVRISLEFKIQSKRNTNYKKLEFEIQNTKIQNNDIYNENTKFKTICSCAQPVVRISLEFEIQNTRNTKYKKLKFEIQNKRLIFIWENGIFFFAQLCLVVAGTWFQ